MIFFAYLQIFHIDLNGFAIYSPQRTHFYNNKKKKILCDNQKKIFKNVNILRYEYKINFKQVRILKSKFIQLRYVRQGLHYTFAVLLRAEEMEKVNPLIK